MRDGAEAEEADLEAELGGQFGMDRGCHKLEYRRERGVQQRAKSLRGKLRWLEESKERRPIIFAGSVKISPKGSDERE